MLTPDDISAIHLSLQLAFTTTIILFFIGTPLAWWLASGRSFMRGLVFALVAVPLILPPTVLGFYLLILLSPQSVFGQWVQSWFGVTLPFSFTGLVIASCIYSLPFVVQPLYTRFNAIDKTTLDAAATLGASKLDVFFSVVIPMCWSGFLVAGVLGFAHTLGEFGIVLMIGGSIAGETKVIAIQIYEHVELLQYDKAHMLSIIMLLVSFVVLILVYGVAGKHNSLNTKNQAQ